MARKEKDDQGSEKDLATEFGDAIWDAANKFGGKSKTTRIDNPTEESLWLTKDVLTFSQFCASPDHMNFPPLTERQNRVAEYLFGDDPKKMFDTGRSLAVLVWGKGSGKDTIAVMMILYMVYVLLCLKNPQKFLDVPDNADIDLLNVAASAKQADTVFFHKMKTAVLNWPWLKTKFGVQMSGRFYSASQDKQGITDKVTITMDAIVFPHNIRAFSWSSESETMEGKSLLVYVMDEADAFKTKSDRRNADKIFRVCRTSASSRFKGKHKGFVISYPRSKNGFILTLYEKTKNFLNVYSDLAKTWEVLPRDKFSPQTFEFEGNDVPMDFYDDFRLDPIGSKRALMCEAPLAEEAFMEEPDKVDACAAKSGPPLYEFRDESKDGYVRKTISKFPFMPDRLIKYILTLDLGIKDNPAALTLSHRENDRIVVDFVTRWIPNKKEKIEVDLMNVEDVIVNIFQSVTVESLYADHWNSPLFIQRLRSKGYRGDIIKLEYEDYEAFKRLVYAGNIVLPKHTPLLEEIKNLQLYSGRHVDHPEGGNNDMAVTVVMAVRVLTKVAKASELSSNLAAEGEYVGENMSEALDVPEEKTFGMDYGIVVDGIPL